MMKERTPLASVLGLAILYVWTASFFYHMKANFSSGKVILMDSNINLEANFFSAPSLNSTTARKEGLLYVAEPLDACQNLSNKPEQSPNGTPPFVLIVSGGCSFEEKVINSERAGFKAAMVHD